MKFYLGIAGMRDHGAAAAIVNERGELLAASEEERYTRVKFDPSFPINSIRACLVSAGIDMEDISEVGYYYNPRLYKKEKMVFLLKHMHHLPSIIKKAANFSKSYLATEEIKRRLSYKGPVTPLAHHLCHAASAFFASPFPEATVVSIDGVGEWETSWIGYGKGKGIKHLESLLWPHSLGMVYAAFTQFLGFKYDSDEYKVMGLSAYGSLSYYDSFREMIRVLPDGKFEIKEAYFDYPHWHPVFCGRKCTRLFGNANKHFAEPSERDKNLAASLQKRTEDVFIAYVKRAVELTGMRKVCLAGGVALNCVAIGEILRRKVADLVYVGPASGDAGCAAGAAYYLASIRSPRYERSPLKNAYLGLSFTDEEVKSVLKRFNLDYKDCGNNTADMAANLIASGKIIGWFQGRTEYGQRALGARSILANPALARMKHDINEKVKYRELFRPLAPSVLEEKAHQYFDCYNNTSPFMTHAFMAKPGVAGKIPAVVHVDGTARAQTVSKEENGIYYDLIEKVGEKIGHPVVLNTSFNIKGEPIVNSPEDAIKCFLKTGLDALVIGRFIVERKQ